MKLKTRRKGSPTRLAFLFLIAVVLLVSSCNVTRKITTESQYVTKGDTCTVITTKTVESYDASKKGY